MRLVAVSQGTRTLLIGEDIRLKKHFTLSSHPLLIQYLNPNVDIVSNCQFGRLLICNLELFCLIDVHPGPDKILPISSFLTG